MSETGPGAKPGEFEQFQELEALRKDNYRLQRKIAEAHAKTGELVDAVYRAAREAAVTIGLPKVLSRPKSTGAGKGKPEVALLHTTDWQYGKRTESYSMQVAEERLVRMCDKVDKLTTIQRAAHPVSETHVLLGGDLVEGVDIFPGQGWEIEAYLYHQIFGCVKVLTDIIRRQVANFDVVHLWEEEGNHGRLGKRGQFPTSDNVDRMIYRIVREILTAAGQDRLVWHPLRDDAVFSIEGESAWYNMVEIGNYRGLLIHGDEIFSYGQTPLFGVLKKNIAWSSGVVPRFDDTYQGHYHTPATLTMANGGRIFMTGSVESGNTFAAKQVGAIGKPSQRLHFIEPVDAKVTAEYTVWLDE